MEGRISFLEAQLSMIEAALVEKKFEAMKWETNANNLKIMNDEHEEKIKRLRIGVYAGNVGRAGVKEQTTN